MIRTITAERDKAETETMVLERELVIKENQLRELKSENQEKGMREHLKDLLENFDSQDDLKKREIIQLIIPKAIVYKDNKLKLWVRSNLGDRPTRDLTARCSESEFSEDFGHGVASYRPPVGMEQKGDLNFSEKHNCNDSVEGSVQAAFSSSPSSSSSSALSHLEESGSSELEMAGWTGLFPTVSVQPAIG